MDVSCEFARENFIVKLSMKMFENSKPKILMLIK